jgi:hypothetical protein
VEAFPAAAAKAAAIGKTGADGSLTWRPPANMTGPCLFAAEWKDKAPAGEPYDAVNYEASLSVNW